MLTTRTFFLIGTLLVAGPALPCSITVVDTLKRTFQEADAVFVGRAVSVEEYAAVFEVDERFKGVGEGRFALSMSSSCDIAGFQPGRVYLVIARQHEGQFHARLGSYTTEITSETQPRLELVRKRARWWRSSASRFAPLHAVSLVWREIAYRASQAFGDKRDLVLAARLTLPLHRTPTVPQVSEWGPLYSACGSRR